MQDEEAWPGVLVATPSAPLEEKLAFRCGEGAQAGAEIDCDALAPAPPPPPPPLPPPVGAYQLPPLPTDDGFDDATRARHRDPLADEDGVVRPDFRPPLAPGSKFDAKYRQWWKLFVFLRTWSAAFNLSQRALESLTKMLTLVCNDHFKVSMSHYITSKVLGLAEPGFIEYAVCGECHKLHAQCTQEVGDDQKPCAHVRRYQRVQSCPACDHRRQPQAAAPAASDSKEEKKVEDEQVAPPKSTEWCCGVSLYGGDKRPRLSYCYRPLSKRLAQLLARPGFEESCERWRKDLHDKPPGIMMDRSHGAFWRRFLDVRYRDLEGCMACERGDPSRCVLRPARAGQPPLGVHPVRSAPFLSRPYGFGLTLNADWFQPYEHVVYCVGVIYIIANVEREHRCRRENVILVGVLPGGTEKDVSLNTYLEPLVDELLRMQPVGPGVRIATRLHPAGIPVRAALICVLCDMPASRKVSGFTSFHSIMGCTRCKRDAAAVPAVPASERKVDRAKVVRHDEVPERLQDHWSDSDHDKDRHSTVRSLWEVKAVASSRPKKPAAPPKEKRESIWHRAYRLAQRRSDHADRKCAQLWLRTSHERDRTARKEYKKATGVVWSELLRLPYFKASRMTVPDPMHQLYMGIAKFTLHWLRAKKEWGKTTEGERALKAMQQVLDDMELPSDTCRILNKWASNMSDLNAAQWKAFVTYLSAAVFDGRLTKKEQELWDHLVAASKLLAGSYLRVAVPEARGYPRYVARTPPVAPVTGRPDDPARHGFLAKAVLYDEKDKAASDTDVDYHTDPEESGDEHEVGSARHWYQHNRDSDDISKVWSFRLSSASPPRPFRPFRLIRS